MNDEAADPGLDEADPNPTLCQRYECSSCAREKRPHQCRQFITTVDGNLVTKPEPGSIMLCRNCFHNYVMHRRRRQDAKAAPGKPLAFRVVNVLPSGEVIVSCEGFISFEDVWDEDTICLCSSPFRDHSRTEIDGQTTHGGSTSATSSRASASSSRQDPVASRSAISAAAASSFRLSPVSPAEDFGQPLPISAYSTMMGSSESGTTNSRRKASYERPRNEQQLRITSRTLPPPAVSSPARQASSSRQTTSQQPSSSSQRKVKGNVKPIAAERTIVIYYFPLTVPSNKDDRQSRLIPSTMSFETEAFAPFQNALYKLRLYFTVKESEARATPMCKLLYDKVMSKNEELDLDMSVKDPHKGTEVSDMLISILKANKRGNDLLRNFTVEPVPAVGFDFTWLWSKKRSMDLMVRQINGFDLGTEHIRAVFISPRHHHIRGPILPFYEFSIDTPRRNASLVHRCMVRYFVDLVKSQKVRPVWQDVEVKLKCLPDCLKSWAEARSSDSDVDSIDSDSSSSRSPTPEHFPITLEDLVNERRRAPPTSVASASGVRPRSPSRQEGMDSPPRTRVRTTSSTDNAPSSIANNAPRVAESADRPLFFPDVMDDIPDNPYQGYSSSSAMSITASTPIHATSTPAIAAPSFFDTLLTSGRPPPQTMNNSLEAPMPAAGRSVQPVNGNATRTPIASLSRLLQTTSNTAPHVATPASTSDLSTSTTSALAPPLPVDTVREAPVPASGRAINENAVRTPIASLSRLLQTTTSTAPHVATPASTNALRSGTTSGVAPSLPVVNALEAPVLTSSRTVNENAVRTPIASLSRLLQTTSNTALNGDPVPPAVPTPAEGPQPNSDMQPVFQVNPPPLVTEAAGERTITSRPRTVQNTGSTASNVERALPLHPNPVGQSVSASTVPPASQASQPRPRPGPRPAYGRAAGINSGDATVVVRQAIPERVQFQPGTACPAFTRSDLHTMCDGFLSTSVHNRGFYVDAPVPSRRAGAGSMTMEGGRLFLDFLIYWFSNRSLHQFLQHVAGNYPEGYRVSWVDPTTILTEDCGSAKVSTSVGQAPFATVVQAAYDNVLSDVEVFQDLSGYCVPRFRGLSTMDRGRHAKFKAAGFLTLCLIVKYKMAPHRLSPILLWLVLDGFNGLGVDLDFFKICHDWVFKRFSELERCDNLTITGLGANLSEMFIHANLLPNEYANINEEQKAEIKRKFLCSLGVGSIHPHDEIEVHALTDGIFIPLYASGRTTIRNFLPNEGSRGLIRLLYSADTDLANTVVGLLQIPLPRKDSSVPLDADPNKTWTVVDRADIARVPLLESYLLDRQLSVILFRRLLVGYLQGEGHPDDYTTPEGQLIKVKGDGCHVTDEVWEQERNSPSVRARAFYHLMTGFRHVTYGTDKEIKVVFDAFPTFPQYQIDSENTAPFNIDRSLERSIQIHACSKVLDVSFTRDFRHFILENNQAWFDAVFHNIVLGLKSQFNTL